MNYSTELILESRYEEAEKVEGLLNELQSSLDFDDEFYARLMLTVSEAATNGIVHGNKLDESKKVRILAQFDGEVLTVSVKDEGEGFTPSEVADPLAEENLLKTSGRGVFLMEEYADEVTYTENGTCLTLKFKV
ncbi:ATP-binding protein [Balneola vulgaris]|jgi:serine/threonine-protein kinase RsbW|uniref:ATP-binding protein n=1 Tax=Balneola vulgaris TaxID=287535 RepID=UPI00037668EE|nr:ATP-binding protein [Balneola vulgaris]